MKATVRNKDGKMEPFLFVCSFQTIESLTEVEACAVCLCGGSRFVAFIVPSPPRTEALSFSSSAHHGDQDPYLSKPNRDAFSSTSVHRHGDQALSSDDHHGECVGDGAIAPAGLERSIQRRLPDLLPSHAIPDSLVFISKLPLTAHGKARCSHRDSTSFEIVAELQVSLVIVDDCSNISVTFSVGKVALGELKVMYEKQRQHLGTLKKRLSPDTLRKTVQTLWKVKCADL